MSDKPKKRTSTLYSISDLKGYLYKIRSYDGLHRWHDIEHMFTKGGHPYNNRLPEIIKVKDTEEDIRKYPEIMYNILVDKPFERTKYDVDAPVRKVVEKIPSLGIDVFELTEYYSVGHDYFESNRTPPKGSGVYDVGNFEGDEEDKTCLTSGLFIYRLDRNEICYNVGMMEGDVIIKVSRPVLEKVAPVKWVRQHLDYTEDYDELYPKSQTRSKEISTVSDMMSFLSSVSENERVIFTIIRNGNELEIPLNVPFVKKLRDYIEQPKVVIKRVLHIEEHNGYLYMYYDDKSDFMYKAFEGIYVEVDDNGQLVMDIPTNLIDTKYEIDNEGKLIVIYE